MERLVDPILTDIRIESAAASARGQHWTSRMIRAAGTISLLKALTLQGWTSFWSIQKSSAEDRRLMSRAVAYTVVATSVGVLLLVLPLLRSGRTQSLVPVLWDALPIALPFALFVGLVYGFKSSVMSRRSLAAAVALSVFCSIASITVLGWVAPLASKAFRMRAGSSFLSNPSEVTLGEFRTRIAADGPYDVLASDYHTRWSLAAAPMVLTMWAFLLVARLPPNRWILGIVAVATCVAYVLLMLSGRVAIIRYGQPPIAGAWLPNAAFVAAMILLTRRTPNEYASPRERRTTVSL